MECKGHLNSIENTECANVAEKKPDPIETLSHIIFNVPCILHALSYVKKHYGANCLANNEE